MKISNIAPLEVLRTIMIDSGFSDDIYVSKAPTSALPSSYTTIHQNGAISTNLSKMGIVKGSILIENNVKMLSNGQRNKRKHEIFMEKFDELFKDNKNIEKDGYTFSLNTSSILYSGGGVIEGYTSDLININFIKI